MRLLLGRAQLVDQCSSFLLELRRPALQAGEILHRAVMLGGKNLVCLRLLGRQARQVVFSASNAARADSKASLASALRDLPNVVAEPRHRVVQLGRERFAHALNEHALFLPPFLQCLDHVVHARAGTLPHGLHVGKLAVFGIELVSGGENALFQFLVHTYLGWSAAIW